MRKRKEETEKSATETTMQNKAIQINLTATEFFMSATAEANSAKWSSGVKGSG